VNTWTKGPYIQMMHPHLTKLDMHIYHPSTIKSSFWNTKFVSQCNLPNKICTLGTYCNSKYTFHLHLKPYYTLLCLLIASLLSSFVLWALVDIVFPTPQLFFGSFHLGHQGSFWSFSFPLVFWLAFIASNDVTVGLLSHYNRFFFLTCESW
jgi:hypothetical protein